MIGEWKGRGEMSWKEIRPLNQTQFENNITLKLAVPRFPWFSVSKEGLVVDF